MLYVLSFTTLTFAADTDNDGLLDALDAPRYDTLATGTLNLSGLGIQDLDGVNALHPDLLALFLGGNQITKIDSGDFAGLNTNTLQLFNNEISEIEPYAFSGLKLRDLNLNGNQFSDLHLEGGIYETLFHLGIDRFDVKSLFLDDAQVSEFSYDEIARETTEIIELSMVGMSFLGEPPENLESILSSTSLQNVTIDESLYGMYSTDFDAFDAAEGTQLTIVATALLGDCNDSGTHDFDDLACVDEITQRDAMLSSLSLPPGDVTGDGVVLFADFIELVTYFGDFDRSYLQGNFDLDEKVGFDDFLILVENFGELPSNTASLTVASVPESSSMGVGLFGFLLALHVRRVATS